LPKKKIVNLFIFWFIAINLFYKKLSPYKTEKIGFNKSPPFLFLIQSLIAGLIYKKPIIEEKRITWWSYISGLIKIEQFKGEKGKILYSQPLFLNIILLVIFMILFPILIKAIESLDRLDFLTSISFDAAETKFYIKIFFNILKIFIILPIIGLIGMILSRNLIIYQNCILITLPVF